MTPLETLRACQVWWAVETDIAEENGDLAVIPLDIPDEYVPRLQKLADKVGATLDDLLSFALVDVLWHDHLNQVREIKAFWR